MIVIVTGGRDYAGDKLVAELDGIHADAGIDALIYGCARGADRIAQGWGMARVAAGDQIQLSLHEADWERHGKRAGPERNQRMVDAAVRIGLGTSGVLCLVAPGGRGTADCVARALKAGIEVRRVS